MVAKLRRTANNPRDLGDSVHADEIEGRVKAAKENASRGLRDRQEIYEEGQNVIKLGRHRFSVNTQPLELTMVPKDAGMTLHLTGTGFYERIEDPEFVRTREYWAQELVSETREVYRGEFLAYSIFADAELGRGDLIVPKLHEAALHDGDLLRLVRNYASERYDEGYERGIHDADATKILEKLLRMRDTADLLRYAPSARALATMFWAIYPERKKRSLWESEARSLVRLRSQFQKAAMARLHDELDQAIVEHLSSLGIATSLVDVRGAGAYLLEEIARQPPKFVLSAEADALLRRFDGFLHEAGGERDLEQDLRSLRDEPARAFQLARTWMAAFLAGEDTRFADEAVVALLYQGTVSREVSSAQATTEVEGYSETIRGS